MKNEMEIIFDAVSDNESFARVAVAAFISHLNPTLEEMADIKTAVSEAVTNSIIHGYGELGGYGRAPESGGGPKARGQGEESPGKVRIHCILDKEILHIDITDAGRGIENVEQAMEPLFTTRPELERSGMGFAFMEAFMDDLEVESRPGMGTTVRMVKKIGVGDWLAGEEV